ncbi:MAG: integrase [Candidatus Korarchaeum sp.]
MRGWDREVDFESIKKTLTDAYAAEKASSDRRARRRLAYIAILLIQLRNGSRIGEAIEAARKFKVERVREVRVRLEKQRRYEERLMILPETIAVEDLDLIDFDGITKYAVNNFSVRRFGVNTHSLRYAFVTYYGKKYSPQVIAKFTGHKNLNHLLTYTQRKQVEDVLRGLNF